MLAWSPQGIDLAAMKPALQSSVSRWSRGRVAAEDAVGANSGEMPRDYGFHTKAERQPWWQVDLQDAFLIRRVVIFNRKTQPQRLVKFSLLKSLDGRDWSPFFSKTDAATFGVGDDLPYVAEIAGEHLARFVRVRLDGHACLHFRQCQIFGDPAEANARMRLALAEQQRRAGEQRIPPDRTGDIVKIDGLAIFADSANYAAIIVSALRNGSYEGRERRLVRTLLRPGDRVLEVGTALGVVSMTAASVVGAGNVRTYDANPDIVADARDNFRRNGLQAIDSRVGVLQSRHACEQLPETVDFFIHKAFWGSRLNASLASASVVKAIKVPTFYLEDEIRSFAANVLISDIEGGEVNLLMQADLSGVRLIIMETHYWSVGEAATDAMIRKLVLDGFALHLGHSGNAIAVLRR